MKKFIILSFLILPYFLSFAQKVPFETLETFSEEINNIQRKADGKSYLDGKQYYEISFPESSFFVSFYNQLATKVVYKENNGEEILELTEKIDLTKAINIKDMENGGTAGALRLYFPAGIIKTQIFKKGDLIQTLNVNYIEVFFDKSNKNDKERLLLQLNQLIAEIKKAKNSTELIKDFFKTYFVKTVVKPYGDAKSFDYEFTNDAQIIYRKGLTKNQDDLRNPFQWYYIKLSEIKIEITKSQKILFGNLIGITISNLKGHIPHGMGKKFVKVEDTKYEASHIVIPFKPEAESELVKLKDIIVK